MRQQSADLLRLGLLATAIAAVAFEEDPRDVMVGLALHFDAARRLGLDPVVTFEDAASRIADPRMRALLRDFGHRDDITPAAFGWRVVETPDGPDYAPT